MIKPCQRCGKTFDGYGNAKYCSDCWGLARKEYHRKYYAANCEQIRKNHRRYCLQHREECRARDRERYRRKCIEFWKQQEATT